MSPIEDTHRSWEAMLDDTGPSDRDRSWHPSSLAVCLEHAPKLASGVQTADVTNHPEGKNAASPHESRARGRAPDSMTARLSSICSMKTWTKRLGQAAAGDSGTELFEFALVVPILLTLLLGIFWMVRAYNVYETLTRASREGARYAALPSSVAQGNAYADAPSSSCASNTNAFNNHVAPVLTASGLDASKVQTYCQKTQWLEGTDPQQCGVVVSFNYPVQFAIPFTSLNGTTINIKARAQMRQENQSAGGTCP